MVELMIRHDLLEELQASIQDIDRDSCAALIGELEKMKALAYGKMWQREPGTIHQEDRMLEIDEAATKLGVTKDYLYRHAKTLPFTVRVAPRQLRFSLHGIGRYIQKKRNSSH